MADAFGRPLSAALGTPGRVLRKSLSDVEGVVLDRADVRRAEHRVFEMGSEEMRGQKNTWRKGNMV